MDYKNQKAELEVLGNIYINPMLLDNPSYFFNEEDFSSDFNKVLFASFYCLFENGVSSFQPKDIVNFLEGKVKSKAIFEASKGEEFLVKLKDSVSSDSFEYYYQRLRKFSLMRCFREKLGMDLSWIYDDNNIIDIKKREKQDKAIDKMSLADLNNAILQKIDEVTSIALAEEIDDDMPAGEGIEELFQQYEKKPKIGLPLYGKYRNVINSGANKGYLFLVSAASGVGKTRRMIADSCCLGLSGYFNRDGEFISTGEPQSCDYIIVEQQIKQIQPIILSFVAGVDQNKIEKRHDLLTKDERDRINKSIEIIKNGKLHIVRLHEYNLIDLKETIRKGIYRRNAEYFFFDYIEINIKIMEEINKRLNGSLREDQVLFMITNLLKDLASNYNIFIESSTQLNGTWGSETHMDSRMLAGGKCMDRKIDYGEIMLELTPEDEAKIAPIMNTGLFNKKPTIKCGIYKNRGDKYKNCIVWCEDNRDISRIDPLFVTDYNYRIIEFENTDYNFISIQNTKNDSLLLEEENEETEKTTNNVIEEKEEEKKEKEEKPAFSW